MIGHRLISWPGTMKDFVFGQSYTRGAIRQALGGDLSSSLPHRDASYAAASGPISTPTPLMSSCPAAVLGSSAGRESSRRSVSSYRAS